MRIILIRHGKSIANTNALVTGTKQDPLSEVGIQQAKILRKFIRSIGIKPEIFISSDWLRAQQTARIIWPQAQWVVDCRLGETDAGVAANMPLSHFLKLDPYFYNSHKNKYPQGESHEDLNVRTIGWLNEVLTLKYKSIAVVAHSGPISCLIQHALNIKMESFPAAVPLNASVSILDFIKLKSSQKFVAKLAGFSMLPESRMNELAGGSD